MVDRKCEILSTAQQLGLPNSNRCPYADCCDGSTCFNFDLDASLSPGVMEQVDETTAPVDNQQRFYSRLEKYFKLKRG